MTWHERVGRCPIRMHDIFPQHRSRTPPKAWPAAAVESGKRLSCTLRLAKLLRAEIRRRMR
eukprot:8385947-Heterocapsa_arctica.AAC.1